MADQVPSDHRCVSFTTYRRSGDEVATPVWIVDLGDGTYGFNTEAGSGKVKRLRNDDRCVLRPCDTRGRVPDGAARWTGTATVVRGADSEHVHSFVRRKYGWQVRLINLMGVIRRNPPDRVGVVITLDR